MAKALLGYVGGPDLRLLDEVRRLRRQVSDLQIKVGILQATCDELAAAAAVHEVSHSDVLALTMADVREHAGAM